VSERVFTEAQVHVSRWDGSEEAGGEFTTTVWVVSWDTTGYGDDWMTEGVFATLDLALGSVTDSPVGAYRVEELPLRTS
jgi:hypothetical protein